MSTPKKKTHAKAKGTLKDLASKKNPKGGFSFGGSQTSVSGPRKAWIEILT